MTILAHTGPNGSLEDGQTLEDHLRSVADQCAFFAKDLGYEHWGYALGLLHDAGKASGLFQRRLAGSLIRVDHATAGAQLSMKLYDDTSPLGKIVSILLSLAITGHHGGIPNVSTASSADHRTPLVQRLKKDVPDYLDAYYSVLNSADLKLPSLSQLEPVPPLKDGRNLPEGLERRKKDYASCNSFSLQLLCRFLFSCLVDADYLDTERFVCPDVFALRVRNYNTIDELLSMLDSYMEQIKRDAPDTLVNKARAQILADCIEAAHRDSGLFTLSVPTGGGKTLASMMFALKHAYLHGKRRVIFAIPFTSVAQQTATIFQLVFGKENVLEHHSGHITSQRNSKCEVGVDETSKSERLATQNWDAPIIVTTNVQLLESFFANTPSKCRKLHNVANSVIVFDEVQAMPDPLLTPTLALLESLCIDFSTSIVLCSATQPALDEYWPFGLSLHEISAHQEYFDEVFNKRVRYEPLAKIACKVLAKELSAKNQVLCIVGTKKKALDLYRDVVNEAKKNGIIAYDSKPLDEGFFHLSTNMVAMHRMHTIGMIRGRLDCGERCVVVSTQLIEAGVDFNFPEVFREIAGVDSLMQAAGRCNREGTLKDDEGNPREGIVHIFEFEADLEPEGKGLVRTWLGAMKSITRNLLSENNRVASSDLVNPFFAVRYKTSDLDRGGIYKDISHALYSCCKTLEYERYAREYRVIEDKTEPVYVPWDDEGCRLLDQARRLSTTGESSALLIPLQQYAVGVYPHILQQLKSNGSIELIGDYCVLVQDASVGRYSEETGMLPVGEGELNNLII